MAKKQQNNDQKLKDEKRRSAINNQVRKTMVLKVNRDIKMKNFLSNMIQSSRYNYNQDNFDQAKYIKENIFISFNLSLEACEQYFQAVNF